MAAGKSSRINRQYKTKYRIRNWREYERGADVIVPVPGPGTQAIGVLVVGRRLDRRLVRSVDLSFLEVLGAAAGLALARLQLLDAPGAGSGEASPAEECPVCRCLTEAGEPPGCACGSAYVATEVPKLLAGKFRLTRRLGAGGMGAVYLSRDLRLERDVAIKTLTERSLVRLMGLKPEAWAMATVTHPAVAQIHGIESWRGRSFLVVELLAGGTLEDRLREGPLDALAGGVCRRPGWPTPWRHCTRRDSCTETSSPATSGSPRRGRRSCWISGWRTPWTTPPLWAAPCPTSHPRCSPAARPRKPTMSGRCAWFYTKWCRAGIPSPAAPWSRCGAASGVSASLPACLPHPPRRRPWPPSRRRS